MIDPEKRLRQAALDLAQANRDLAEAERRFNEAVHAVELAEAAAAPSFREVRGILKQDRTDPEGGTPGRQL